MTPDETARFPTTTRLTPEEACWAARAEFGIAAGELREYLKYMHKVVKTVGINHVG